jgi:hypothetical protein
MKRVSGLLWLACAASLGCGRQDLDLLSRAQKADPCLGFASEQECDANAALGCSFQPNREGCRSDDPACQPGLCRGGDPFVRRVEKSFFLNGEPFRFAGVSSWAMLQPGLCATVKPAERQAWITREYDELVPARAKVARFFAFQSAAGSTGKDFTLFDAAVTAARRAGVRLQLVLEDNDGGCSQGTLRDAVWLTSGYKSREGTYQLAYRDFAASVAKRYRDEPTVLGYVHMGQLLHGLAPNQLMSLDLDWGVADDGGATYRALQELPAVDFIDVDDYTLKNTPVPFNPAWLEVLNGIDKPATIGEGAFVLLGGDDASLAARGETARQRILSWKDWGFAGALLWAYQPGWGDVSEEFDARPADPILQPGGVLVNAPW